MAFPVVRFAINPSKQLRLVVISFLCEATQMWSSSIIGKLVRNVEIQNYRISGPTPDLLSQNLHVNKIPKCFLHIQV